ncbi:hypothetical protein Xmer_05245 [Xanthomonas campestris pv. merremiae]|nr:hypothetical protein [Xanthomonas campestris pv. merremiae]
MRIDPSDLQGRRETRWRLRPDCGLAVLEQATNQIARVGAFLVILSHCAAEAVVHFAGSGK